MPRGICRGVGISTARTRHVSSEGSGLQIRLTSVQRRLFSRTFLIGALLTATIAACEWAGLLETAERYFYDRRARLCQAFAAAPSKEIVHINIDDTTLQEIGRWPWPRADLARIVEEINAAGAKVIGLDIMMPEDQPPRYARHGRPEAPSYEEIDDDQMLAEAMRAAGDVLAPAGAGFKPRAVLAPVAQAILDMLRSDVEMEADAIREQLVKRFDAKTVENTVRDDFLALQQQAILERVEREVGANDTTLEEVLDRVVPRSRQSGHKTNAWLIADMQYAKVVALQRLQRFWQPAAPKDLPLMEARLEYALAPVPELSEAAALSGYVDMTQPDDAIVRYIPLVASFQGRLAPHMSLTMALAALDVPFSKVKVERDRLVIPAAGGDVEVPMRVIRSAQYGPIGGFMDLAWFGRSGDSWWSIYDYPDFVRPAQQYSASRVWRVESLTRSIQRNEEVAFEAMDSLAGLRGADVHARLQRDWPKADHRQRVEQMREMLGDADVIEPYLAIYRETKPEELDDQGKMFLRAHADVKAIAETNADQLQRLDERRAQLKQDLNGRVVLIGWTAGGLYDYYPTSLHPQCPGVVIQGVAINTILTRSFLRFAPEWAAPLLTLAMGGLVTAIVALMPSYRALLAMVFVTAAYMLLNGYALYDWGNRVLPVAGAVTSAGVVWGILTLYRYIFESAERARITQRFSSYVDPAIVNYYIEDPDRVRLDGEVREMTVVFTDLAGFTTISEKLQERTVPLLNDYMSRMMPIIRRHNGRWNKFLGDGIMFYYNAPQDDPDHARNAVVTVLEMQQAVEDFNKELFKQQLPKVAMRAGLVTGTMVVGDSGSMDPNFYASDYTVLGDNVNLSARLESANKALGSRILCVEQTIKLMGPGILYRPMAMLQVVGKTRGVMTYEPLCLEKDATDEIRQLAGLTRRIVDSYIEGKFEECLAASSQMQDRFGSSKFTKLYLECAREFALAPPGNDFDGTIVLEAK